MVAKPSFLNRRLWRGRRRYRRLAVVVSAGLLFVSTTRAAAQEGDRPLPEGAAFLEQVRTAALTDRLLLSQYTFIAKRTEVPNGQPEKARTEVHQVFPAADPDETYRRLLTVNGEPLGEGEIEEQDRTRREQLAKRARQLADEAVSERDRRLQDAAEARRDEQELFEDILTILEFRMVRREILDGHPTIIVSFTPRRDAKPRTSRGKLFSKARGHFWVSENDHKIVRLEAETIEDSTIGWGLIGRLHKGSIMAFQYRKVDEEVWLPAWSRFSLSGRALLFRTFKVEILTECFEHKKLTDQPRPITALPQ